MCFFPLFSAYFFFNFLQFYPPSSQSFQPIISYVFCCTFDANPITFYAFFSKYMFPSVGDFEINITLQWNLQWFG